MSDKHQIEFAFDDFFTSVSKETALLNKALDHSGDLREKKMFALAGDALLDFHLFEYLIEIPNQTKGAMENKRTTIHTDSSFARIGKKIGLKKYICFPKSANEIEKETGDSYYNMTLEALAYVAFIYGGINASRDFFRRFIVPDVENSILE